MVTITPLTLPVCSLVIIFSGSGFKDVSADLMKGRVQMYPQIVDLPEDYPVGGLLPLSLFC